MVLEKLHFQMEAQHLEALTTPSTALIYVFHSLVLLINKAGVFKKCFLLRMWKQRKDTKLFIKTVILLINIFMKNYRFFSIALLVEIIQLLQIKVVSLQ